MIGIYPNTCFGQNKEGEGKRRGHSFTQRSKSQTRVLACVLASSSILRGLIAVSNPRPPPPSVCPVPLFPQSHLRCDSPSVLSVGLAADGWEHRCRTAGLHPTGPGMLEQERAGPHAGLHRDTSISHIDIIPMFYLSPCNSFYISGLCSLASVQSQPRDTGL